MGNKVYLIEDIRQSEHAMVLFTKQALTSDRFVMKLLRNYKDTRYSLETVEKRQQCQLEALRRNRIFSPGVYIGLAPVRLYDLSKKYTCIGELLTSPSQDSFESNVEYILLMHQLPEERNLTVLLKEQDTTILQELIRSLAEHIAAIHMQFLAVDTIEDDKQWSTYEQLREKLEHNFGLLDLVLTTHTPDLNYDFLRRTISWLKKTLLELFNQKHFRDAFEQRIHERRIQHCHGDLKLSNIWILPYDEEPSQRIKILDAIDFNSTYCNIDILSDFAMLVVDIQARTSSDMFATEMIEHYLKLTDQVKDSARAVLDYYLIEKALVGAAISVVYDNAPELGLKLLNIAVKRLQSLLSQLCVLSVAVTQLSPYLPSYLT